jgi:ribosomal protein S18 acetylase RimI-like enzyme
MIRPTTRDDTDAMLTLAVAAGIAPAGETQALAEVLADSLVGKLGPDHLWVTDDDGGPVGVAYYAPERMTDRTWNLYMIAVHPARQGQGRGTSLLRHVERDLIARGARLLLVDTSSLPEFERTRAFYRKCGYEEEARIREFWKAGDDKIIYRKALPAASEDA